MDKLTAWIVTVIGVLLILAMLGYVSVIAGIVGWIVALEVLIIGINCLIKNYKK